MILLDTHVVIWLLTARERLSARAQEAIQQARSTGERLAYSPVSLYEIVYAVHSKRLPLKISAKDFVSALQAKLDMVPLTAEIVVCAAELPASFHGDPVDRIITATAIVENCILITKDEKIQQANLCKLLW
jgi:PIN domain nuclease of toxin-antitoxin system